MAARRPPHDPASRVRVDVWTWSVRLFASRSAAAAACRAGHVRVNGERVKPATPVGPGDEVRVRGGAVERLVVVRRTLVRRVGAAVAVECYEDRTPPPPPREERVVVAERPRGSGRPTKRERRAIERLRGH